MSLWNSRWPCQIKYRKQIAFFGLALCVLITLPLFAVWGMAEIDFCRIDSGKKPLFAQQTNAFRDGGTVLYAGMGYKLTAWKRLDGYSGPDLHFAQTLWPLPLLLDKSKARFVTNSWTSQTDG